MAVKKGTIFTPVEERLAAKINKTESCWLWTACRNTHGYGKIRYKGKSVRAHRLMYELANGVTLRPDQHLLHICDVRECVNPSHLRIGTPKENTEDMVSKKRHPHGETSYAKITEAQARKIKEDTRPQRVIAEEYGLCQQSVSLIKRGINWSHI